MVETLGTTGNEDLIDRVPETFQRLSNEDKIVYSPSISGELYTGPIESLEARVAIASLTGLMFAVIKAREASLDAISWRDYKVGVTAVMVNFNQGKIGYLEGYNVKPSEDSLLNLHAEQVVLAKGRKQKLDRCLALALYADPNDDNSNPLGLITLQPCEQRCIGMMKNCKEVDFKTLILGVNLDFSECELYSFGYLLDEEYPSFKISSFSLQTEEDLYEYDRTIVPEAIEEIERLYQSSHSINS